MPDFLDNLIARALGLADVVMPRPVSLFEPQQPSATFTLDKPFEQKHVAAEPAMEAAPVEFSEDTTNQSTLPKLQHESTRPGPTADGLITSAIQLELTAATAAHEKAERQPAATGQPASARQLLTPPEHVVATITDLPELQPPTLLIAPAVVHKASENPLPTKPGSSSREFVAAGDTAPTIKVTIGRVDVRAVLPDLPKARPANERRNPALTLEEYLKQRSRGKQ